MKKTRKILALAVAVAMLFSLSSIASFGATNPGSVSIDGTKVVFKADQGQTYVDKGNVMVPIGSLARNMNIPVSWDGKTKTATFGSGFKFTLKATTAETPYGKVALTGPVVMKSNRLYASAENFGTVLGYKTEAVSGSKENINIITKVDMNISAAASLKDALAELQTMYAKEKPGTKLNINLAGSGTLQQQIEQGAKVDLFISAAEKNMNALKDKNLLNNNTLINLLGNKLVLVVPSDSKVEISDFASVDKTEGIKKIALGEPKTVPAGQYAEDVFNYCKTLDQVKAKTVYAKDVREVLTWVETGNVDAGVVYSSDAKTSSKVKVVATAAKGSHTPIVYPAAVLKGTSNDVAAKDFLNYINGPEGNKVFLKYGFSLKD